MVEDLGFFMALGVRSRTYRCRKQIKTGLSLSQGRGPFWSRHHSFIVSFTLVHPSRIIVQILVCLFVCSLIPPKLLNQLSRNFQGRFLLEYALRLRIFEIRPINCWKIEKTTGSHHNFVINLHKVWYKYIRRYLQIIWR